MKQSKLLIPVHEEGCQQRSDYNTLSPSALSPLPAPSPSLTVGKSGWEVSAQSMDQCPASKLCRFSQKGKVHSLSSTVKVD